MSLPFLLEIGTEEIPDWMIPGALESLRGQLEGLGIAARTDATPRRLVARADGLLERLPDTEERVTGPRQTAPAKAVEGFARKQGITPADLSVEGEYYTYLRKKLGRRMIDVLAESLPGIILKIAFPKTMYWTGKTGPRFIRPIRWLVALLGDDVIPFELAGVHSSNITVGQRRTLQSASQAGLPVTIENYEQTLRANCVILSAAARRKKIEDEIAALGIRLKPDPALLETLVYLTEYPTPILGEFDPQFLALPEEVLITVMRHHQKYFSVEDESGHLAPRFVAVMNTSADPEGLVRRGNERVLRARFNDARFFWQTDQRKKLADRVADLAHVTFQAKLGSYLEKTDRVVTLVNRLGGDEDAQRAARLAKADLTTELVKEFTELQGIVGGLYARAQGEPDEVWQAIYDHYKPESMEDSVPRSTAGRLVSLADKLDTLIECFRIGMAPTGSRDPFGLRRAAQGVVKIMVEVGLKPRCSSPRTGRSCRNSLRIASGSTLESAASATTKSTPPWPPFGGICRTWRIAWCGYKRSVPRRTSSRWPPASSASRTSCAKPISPAARSHPACWSPDPRANCTMRFFGSASNQLRQRLERCDPKWTCSSTRCW
jgi:glycyl-tRNA synthetase beta chain